MATPFHFATHIFPLQSVQLKVNITVQKANTNLVALFYQADQQ